MGQFVQVNGDYNIKTREGGRITLNTGPGVGEVRVTGNLLVEGDTLTVSAENLNVNDNIITLNYGESGAGVTLRYSGVQVDRGSSSAASFIFDENDNSWNLAFGAEGAYNFADSKLRVSQIATNADTDSGDLILIGSGTGVVKVAGTLNYELQITDDDDIPNKKYVDDAIQLSPTYQIRSPGTGTSADTRVIIADKDVLPNDPSELGSLASFTDQTGYSTFGETAVNVIVDSVLTAQFFSNRTVIQDLEINGTEITVDGLTNQNIFIRTQGTGKLETNYAFQLDQIGVTPAYVSGSTLIYGSSHGLGISGVYFVSDSSTSSCRAGGLICKNKALVFSMIF